MAHRAKKRFGQHFLVDAGVIDAIVREVSPQPGETVVEIGPGEGAITRPLLAQAKALTVIELDRDLAARLRRTPGLEVVEADVLKVDFGALAGERRLRIVGNLPYNISTPILFHLLESVDHVIDQHVMLQKEVVDRMAAAPGRKDYGRLSVMLQWRYTIEPLIDVPASAFDPPPRVESAVVRMTPLPAPEGVDAALLGELVTVAFSQRRKILRHTLGRWLEERNGPGLRTRSGVPRRCRWRSTSRWRARSAPAPGRRPDQLERLDLGEERRRQAALNHIAVSNALLIIGMFAPKLLLAAVLAAAFTGLLTLSAMLFSVLTLGATSVARSHDPDSWERATEKNRST